MRPLLGALLLSLALAACGEPVAPPPDGDGDPGATRYTATVTVLDDGDGAELCLGAVLDSYPPQCGGPGIVGWDWDAVDGEESASGVTWGTYTVVGTWDGERFTLTEPPRPPSPDDRPDPADADRFATPCEPPPGGWRPPDPSRATDEAQQEAMAYARAQPEFAGLWVDQSVNPASRRTEPDTGDSAARERAMNDPALLVLNVRFTDGRERHEAALRERWGGALCVSQARHTLAELERIRAEVTERLDDVLSSSVDEVTGVVEIQVQVADAARRRELDRRYGDGVVRLDGALRPVAPSTDGS